MKSFPCRTNDAPTPRLCFIGLLLAHSRIVQFACADDILYKVHGVLCKVPPASERRVFADYPTYLTEYLRHTAKHQPTVVMTRWQKVSRT